jgi:hypothetical protein
MEGTALAVAIRSEIEIAPRAEPRPFRVSVGEMEAHRQRIARLGANAIWLDYLARATPIPVLEVAGSALAGPLN